MHKVADYRARLEKLSAENDQVGCKHRQEIEHIRSFTHGDIVHDTFLHELDRP